VIGQKNMGSGAGGTNATSLKVPYGIAFDSSGDLWVADARNNRVLEFPAPLTTGESASVVIGQTNLTSTAKGSGASGLSLPTGVAFDKTGDLWVADTFNGRVLEFRPGPSGLVDGESASIVIGQPNFTSRGAIANSTRVGDPFALAFDSAGNLWVSDTGNNRVLEYSASGGFTDGEPASLVIGQQNFTSNAAGTTQTGLGSGPSLYGPYGIAFDPSGNLWVADTFNSRVLEYDRGAGFTNGEAASSVIGQTSFTSNASATTASGLYWPSEIAFDSSGDLWITDGANARVLEYANENGFTTGEPASLVIGQVNYTTAQIPTPATAGSLNGPYGIAFDQFGNVWVADLGNSRVLEYEAQEPFASSTSSTAPTTSSSFSSSSFSASIATRSHTSSTSSASSTTASSNTTTSTLTFSTASSTATAAIAITPSSNLTLEILAGLATLAVAGIAIAVVLRRRR